MSDKSTLLREADDAFVELQQAVAVWETSRCAGCARRWGVRES